MALHYNDIRRSISMSIGFKNKVLMGVFVLLAKSREPIPARWRRLITRYTPDFPLRLDLLNGNRLLINPSDWSQTVIFEEIFLRNSYDLDKLEFVPEVVLDCGAHIGMFSLLARSWFPTSRVIVFEPNSLNIKYLRRQIESNRLDIQLIEAAVSTKVGEVSFDWSNSHSGRLNHRQVGDGGSKVKVVNLPEMVRDLNATSLLLKMDVEGEEMEILPLLVPLLPQQTAIFFEVHSGASGWDTVTLLLEKYGFSTERINTRGKFIDVYSYREKIQEQTR
jgi:FkbM family methyltransferase